MEAKNPQFAQASHDWWDNNKGMANDIESDLQAEHKKNKATDAAREAEDRDREYEHGQKVQADIDYYQRGRE